MIKETKSKAMVKALDDISTLLMGSSRSSAIKASRCVWCQGDCSEDTFRDAISLKEFGISGFCQACQDKTFGGE